MSPPPIPKEISQAIANTCAEMKRDKIEIVSLSETNPPRLITISPAQDSFESQCRQKLVDSYSFQLEKKDLPPSRRRVWSSSLIKTVHDYAIKYDLSLEAYADPMPPGYPRENPLSFDAQKNKVKLNLTRRPPSSASILLFGLRHEWGHSKDLKALAAYYPQEHAFDPFLNPKSGQQTNAKAIVILKKLLQLMRDSLSSEDEKKQFDQFSPSLFGDLEKLDNINLQNCWRVLFELFRYGDEKNDPKLREWVFDPDFDLFTSKKINANSIPEQNYIQPFKPSGRKNTIDLGRLAVVAELQEAKGKGSKKSLWDEFTHSPQYDPKSIAHLDPTLIQFFRLCIRGAGNFHLRKK